MFVKCINWLIEKTHKNKKNKQLIDDLDIADSHGSSDKLNMKNEMFVNESFRQVLD